MKQINDLIAQLADSDARKRYAAVETLRAMPSLPAEAILALKSATLDADASVAASARAALAANEPSRVPEKPRNILRTIDAVLELKPGVVLSDRDVKLTGSFLLLVAAMLIYIGVFIPISEALKGAPSISYHAEASALALPAAAMGVTYVVFGVKALEFLRGQKQRLPRILLIAAAFILAIGGYIGMEYIMTSLGYR